MTSEERHKARYHRRHAIRENKRKEKLQQIGSYDDIFTYINLYKSFYFCREGVRWKKSIQNYEATLPISTFKLCKRIKSKKFTPLQFLEFDINERGKIRHIKAVDIRERCCQRILCDNYLHPLLAPKFIFDNGASLKNKGTDFSLRRIKTHLLRHYKKYGNNGYIFQYDFSKYFDNIDHSILLGLLQKDIPDKDIYNMTKNIIDSFGDKGLGLGSQVSQTCAIYYPTLLDRYFKEILHIKGYGRYMDDGYAICKDLEEVRKCREGLEKMTKALNITLNPSKITITKLSHTFTFLKKRITLTDTGKVIIRMGRKSITQARRRLKKMFRKYKGKPENMKYILSSYRSWYGMSKGYKNYHTSENYKQLYENLYKKTFGRSEENG